MKLWWSLFIDIEGFSNMYIAGQKMEVYKLVTGLILDLYKIGTRIYPEPSQPYSECLLCLSVHQLGDGFIICPGLHAKDLSLAIPISIAIALMQSTALRGGIARASMSYGQMADFLGCYPKEIKDNLEDGRIVRLGPGIMTIVPVMGEALIRAYKLSKSKPKGPRFLLDKELESQVKDTKIRIIDRYDDHIEIDWIHSRIGLVSDILVKIDITPPTWKNLEEILRNYITVNDKLSHEWKESAEKLIRGGNLIG